MALLRRSRSSCVVPYLDLVELRTIDPMAGCVARDAAVLVRAGITMPPTWVLLAEPFRQAVRSHLPAGHDVASLLRVIGVPKGRDRAARARERLLELELGVELSRELDSLWQDVSPGPLLVSTSPTCEDSSIARAAGLLVRAPLVRSRDELDAAIRVCWAAAVPIDTLHYLRSRRARDLAIAVMLQLLPQVTASGVLASNVRGAPAQSPIAVVGIAPADALLNAHASAHATFLYFDQSSATSGANNPPTAPIRWTNPLLTEIDRVVTRLMAIGPYELEFAVGREGSISALTARRLPGSGYPEGGNAGTTWGRSTHEGPAALTPLSRSLARSLAVERARSAGIVKSRRHARRSPPIALVSGNFYFDLSSLSVPDDGEPVDRVELTELLGAQLLLEDVAGNGPELSLARAGLSVARLGAEQKRLHEECERFDAAAEQQRGWLSELDLAILPDDSLRTTLREGHAFYASAARLLVASERILTRAQRVLVSLFGRQRPGAAEVAAWSVTAGAADLATAKPAVAFGHVLGIAARDVRAHEALSRCALPEAGPTRRALKQWLDAYGDRALIDTELTQPRFAEDPSWLLQLLQAGLTSEVPDADALLSGVRARADRTLAEFESHGSYLEGRMLRDLVVRIRELIRLHARTRVRLGHALSMLRTIVLDVDRRLGRVDPQLGAGASFYGTLEELDGAVGSGRADLRSLFELRRAEHASQHVCTSLPLRFRGCPELLDCLPADLQVLRGLAASSGVVRGTARIVPLGSRRLGEFAPGDVVIVPWLDPGLAPLLLLAGGIISELGNPWSPGAIVARELGVPLVTGVVGAMRTIASRQHLRLDGGSGTVEILTK